MKKLLLFPILFLFGCASTSFYTPVVVSTADGGQIVKSVKTFSTSGDVILPSLISPSKITFSKSNVVGIRKIAVVDGKGNPIFDKSGQPIFNEQPIVAGIYHSTATDSFWRGFSLWTRSVGSVTGTIGTVAAVGAAAPSTSLIKEAIK